MPLPDFDAVDLLAQLQALEPQRLDELSFGVIGFDDRDIVRQYNRHEAEATGLKTDRVLGQNVFTELAQCMNNFLVAERFASARESATPLDDCVPYTLTWRMRPTPVRLRLLWAPGGSAAYIALARRA